MDNRTLKAVVISLVLWYAWMVFLAPPPPPLEEGSADLVDIEGDEQIAEAPSPPAGDLAEGGAPAGSQGTPRGLPALDRSVHPQVVFAQCGVRATVAGADGGLFGMHLPDHEARYEVQPLWSWALAGFPKGWQPYGGEPGPVYLVSDEGRAFVASAGDPLTTPGPVDIDTTAEGVLVTRGVQGDVEIESRFQQVDGDPCRMELSVTWHNRGSQPWSRGLWVGVHDVLEEHASAYDSNPRPLALLDGYLQTWDDLTDTSPPTKVAGEISAFGLAGHYFAAVAVPRAGQGQLLAGAIPRQGQAGFKHGVHWWDPQTLEPGGARTASFELYVGPKESNALAEIDEELTSLISLGFLSVIARPLLWLLKQIQGFAGNWGLSIILLVIVVKAAFFRLTQKAFESSQAMQAIQPQFKEIQEKYKHSPEELQQKMIALYRDNGVNPLGGCLPMLLQMPVWFALYSVLLSAVELYHSEFLYLRDLSQPDPYMVSPALVTAVMFGQQLLMPTANLDPAQARLMRLMPLVFGLLFFTFPAGLVVYVFVNTLLSMLQQIYIKRTFTLKKDSVAAGTGGA